MVAACCWTFVARHSPFFLGLVVGLVIGLIGASVLPLLALADGSLLARLGRAMERAVGTELRKLAGVSAVISDVSFEHGNVDHVVLTPAGCFAVEVKSLWTMRRPLTDVKDLGRKIDQARDGARKTHHLLRSRGVELKPTPVLLLTGPGAPDLAGGIEHRGVLIATLRTTEWLRRRLTGQTGSFDQQTATKAALQLRIYREERIRYELTKRQPSQ
jgi:hypothetical protein